MKGLLCGSSERSVPKRGSLYTPIRRTYPEAQAPVQSATNKVNANERTPLLREGKTYGEPRRRYGQHQVVMAMAVRVVRTVLMAVIMSAPVLEAILRQRQMQQALASRGEIGVHIFVL
ncbi:unnamed protein product [Ceratitis capitata]|uniref:(Mediterranean fruit fly) hypothetical protein n=1 Tax=Ceratitis capitata TaxID=7213 RepID=A0A811UTC6_CERCA|nr:unnamed protein product [Ceratitis capitata]